MTQVPEVDRSERISEAAIWFGKLSPRHERAKLFGIGSAVVCQVILLIIAGWHNRLMISPDAIVYVRIASYYSKGQADLMLSGYWGPMISWLIAPFLLLMDNPLDAGRVVMALSAIGFLFGCLAIFRCLNVSVTGTILGAWLVALVSVVWSTESITPDLLLATFVCFAVSWTMSPRWLESRNAQFGAGLLWGAAYLTKAVALPTGLGVVFVVAALSAFVKLSSIRVALRAVAFTVLGLLVPAIPWVVLLSLKYRRLVWSTTGPLAHSMMGPNAPQQGFHPAVFHPPEPGRLLWFEDPPLELYQSQLWSPFESLALAKHQLKLIYLNFDSVIQTFAHFDWLHIAFCCALLALLVHTPWQKNMRQDRWRWSGAVIACIAGIYLPVFAYADRYYYAVYPLLLVSGIGMIMWLTPLRGGASNIPRLVGLALIVLSFGNPIRRLLPEALLGIDYPQAVYARDLAGRLQAKGLQGPLAGAGANDNKWRGEQIGPYLAFFTNQPYLGSERAPSPQQFKSSGAKLVIFDRQLQLGLSDDPAFRDLDNELFASKEEADKYPLKVYRVASQ